MSNKNDLAADTITAQALHHSDSSTGASVLSLQPASTVGRNEDYQLIESVNDLIADLEQALA